METVERTIQSVFDWSESNRRQLAQELHDTVLQDQIMLYREVEELSQSNSIKETTKKQLTNIAKRMLIIIDDLRYYCQDIRPPYIISLDLQDALEQLCTRCNLQSNIEVLPTIMINTVIENELLKLHIYRIIQELLSNAMKHSHATTILLDIVIDLNGVQIHYHDDGIGMENAIDIESHSHLGISGIYYRVMTLAGTVNIITAAEQGFTMIIEVPIVN